MNKWLHKRYSASEKGALGRQGGWGMGVGGRGDRDVREASQTNENKAGAAARNPGKGVGARPGRAEAGLKCCAVSCLALTPVMNRANPKLTGSGLTQSLQSHLEARRWKTSKGSPGGGEQLQDVVEPTPVLAHTGPAEVGSRPSYLPLSEGGTGITGPLNHRCPFG